MPCDLWASLVPLNSDRTPSCEVILGLDATTAAAKMWNWEQSPGEFQVLVSKSCCDRPLWQPCTPNGWFLPRFSACPWAPGSYKEEMWSASSRNHACRLRGGVCPLLSRQQSFQVGYKTELSCIAKSWDVDSPLGEQQRAGETNPERCWGRCACSESLRGQMLRKLGILCVWHTY